MYRGSANTKASEEAEVGAKASDSGTKEARGVYESQEELLVPHPHGWAYRDSHLRDGEVRGGPGEDGSSVGKTHEVGGRDRVGVRWRRVGEVGAQRRGRMKEMNIVLQE